MCAVSFDAYFNDKKAVESYRFDHFYWCLCLFTSRSPVSVWPSSELAAWPDFSSNSENFENMRGHFVVREVTLPSTSSHAVVTDRTVLRVHHSRHQERVRVVCTTRHQHTSRFVTVSDACTSLPPFRKHVTTIRYIGSERETVYRNWMTTLPILRMLPISWGNINTWFYTYFLA